MTEPTDNLNFEIYPELTIDYILTYVSEEEIFAKYLGIPIGDVNTKDSLCNPLRTDDSPGCKFYEGTDHRLRFTDFAGYTANGKFKSWDCFDCVVAVINMTDTIRVPYYDDDKTKQYAEITLDISPNSGYITLGNSTKKYKRSKLSFMLMLKHIAKQFKIHKYSGATSNAEIRHIIADKTIHSKKHAFTKLQAYFRDWNNHDLNYWRKYHVDVRNSTHRAILKYFHINPLHKGFVNGKLVYSYDKNDLGYSYSEGKDAEGNLHLKFYFPKRTGKEKYKPKFYCNTKRLQGFAQLKAHRFGIVQKSKKDIFLQALHFGLTGIAPQAESNILTKEEWSSINYHCDMWFSLGDFDYAGVRFGIAHYLKYGIEPLFFVRKNTGIKTWISINDIHRLAKEFGFDNVKKVLGRDVPRYFPAKDFSDNIEKLGIEEMKQVVLDTAKLYNPTINALREHYNNLLDWI